MLKRILVLVVISVAAVSCAKKNDSVQAAPAVATKAKAADMVVAPAQCTKTVTSDENQDSALMAGVFYCPGASTHMEVYHCAESKDAYGIAFTYADRGSPKFNQVWFVNSAIVTPSADGSGFSGTLVTKAQDKEGGEAKGILDDGKIVLKVTNEVLVGASYQPQISYSADEPVWTSLEWSHPVDPSDASKTPLEMPLELNCVIGR